VLLLLILLPPWVVVARVVVVPTPGIIPKGCGFTLQNRGHNFSLTPGHPNALEPRKRPYHTIIPGMAVKDSQLFAAFGVMGGFMQPQGHVCVCITRSAHAHSLAYCCCCGTAQVQVLANLIDFHMNPQQALDAARFCIGVSSSDIGSVTHLEEGIDATVVQELEARGHNVRLESGVGRTTFGRGQIIMRDPSSGVLAGGSDPRGDGMAFGY
jgi:gamma-glutamyltranspeptidase / glutathione hydrolase